MIVVVKWEDAIRYWPIMEPMFATVMKETKGYLETADLLKDIINGEQILWAAYDPDRNKVDAVMTTKIIKYPRRKICRVVFMAGGRLSSWKDEFKETIMRYARDQGATGIEGAFRRGWARIFGMEETGVSLFMELPV